MKIGNELVVQINSCSVVTVSCTIGNQLLDRPQNSWIKNRLVAMKIITWNGKLSYIKWDLDSDGQYYDKMAVDSVIRMI